MSRKPYTQWAQKCTICSGWLTAAAANDIVNDDRPGECLQHFVHGECLTLWYMEEQEEEEYKEDPAWMYDK